MFVFFTFYFPHTYVSLLFVHLSFRYKVEYQSFPNEQWRKAEYFFETIDKLLRSPTNTVNREPYLC